LVFIIPYDCSIEPIEVKGIEGMPQGNLDQYVFMPDDPVYDRIPDCVSIRHRRHAVPCYSWPGIHPPKCMALYGDQLRPIMCTFIKSQGVQNLNRPGRYFERAINRALLSQWESSEPASTTFKPEKEDDKG
jgi:alanine dehydrogenase